MFLSSRQASIMGEITRESEENYLEFVQLNIDLRAEDLKSISSKTMKAGMTPHAAGALRRIFENRELPDVRNPYFIRVDLTTGETLYYGFQTLTKSDKSPQIPESHSHIEEWLVYGRDQDGIGLTSLSFDDLPNLERRTRLLISEGNLRELKVEEKNAIGVSHKDQDVIAREFVEASLDQTRTEFMQPIAATLQPDQFKLSRESADHLVAIQGPPGSGKTSVLLERLARIAFANPRSP
jgi:DNA helicase IV